MFFFLIPDKQNKRKLFLLKKVHDFGPYSLPIALCPKHVRPFHRSCGSWGPLAFFSILAFDVEAQRVYGKEEAQYLKNCIRSFTQDCSCVDPKDLRIVANTLSCRIGSCQLHSLKSPR